MHKITEHIDGWGDIPAKETLDKFLDKLEILLRDHYATSWEVQYEFEDSWVDIKMQVTADKYEGENDDDN